VTVWDIHRASFSEKALSGGIKRYSFNRVYTPPTQQDGRFEVDAGVA